MDSIERNQRNQRAVVGGGRRMRGSRGSAGWTPSSDPGDRLAPLRAHPPVLEPHERAESAGGGAPGARALRRRSEAPAAAIAVTVIGAMRRGGSRGGGAPHFPSAFAAAAFIAFSLTSSAM
eukprot:gene543-biopygen12874